MMNDGEDDVSGVVDDDCAVTVGPNMPYQGDTSSTVTNVLLVDKDLDEEELGGEV